ncbi:MAG: MiaB/RimO family radical SAM methylthiotransferase [Candidatus Omnitrophica bacterium]|nr:MiaB/RimO family radical SAM methylthiotransferase [Candidatus Omnitrophota bacterium]
MSEKERNDAKKGEEKHRGKRILLRTFGCQMNDRDSETLLGLFLDKGYSSVENPEDADVILVNTCSVRDHAENRAISLLGSYKNLKEPQNPKCKIQNKSKISNHKFSDTRPPTPDARKIIGLIGCMARNRGEEILKKMHHLDLVVGPAHFDKIPEYVDKIRQEGIRVINTEDGERSEILYRPLYRLEPGYAQVVISTGCSNYCSYCVVPFVRGPLRCRKPKDIIDEVKRNVDLGIRRITLLGQNVNDYHHKPPSHQVTKSQGEDLRGTRYAVHSTNASFVELLKMVAGIEGIEEIDFITSHPKNTSRELFQVMAESSKIKKHIHLPFQSGSNRILGLMNRGYTGKDYIDLARDYRDLVKGTLSTDVIVGFPQETEDDFLQTKDILEKVNFKYAYIFKYSPRPNTKACSFKDDVPAEEKQRRHRILLGLQKQISLTNKL